VSKILIVTAAILLAVPALADAPVELTAEQLDVVTAAGYSYSGPKGIPSQGLNDAARAASGRAAQGSQSGSSYGEAHRSQQGVRSCGVCGGPYSTEQTMYGQWR
jgi:hypothetical protein